MNFCLKNNILSLDLKLGQQITFFPPKLTIFGEKEYGF